MDGTDLLQRPVYDPLLSPYVRHTIRYLRNDLERKIPLAELARITETAGRTLLCLDIGTLCRLCIKTLCGPGGTSDCSRPL
jgi:hypothetical protein